VHAVGITQLTTYPDGKWDFDVHSDNNKAKSVCDVFIATEL